MLQLGVRAHDLGKHTLLSLAEALQEKNIKYIQLAPKKVFTDTDISYGKFSPAFAEHIGETLRSHGVHVPILGCYINPIHQDRDVRKREIDTFKENLKYAKFMGAGMVGTETGYWGKEGIYDPFTYTEGAYKIFLETMKELADYAEKLGVMIGVEAVTVHTLYSPEMMMKFLEDINSPNVQVIFDPVNLINAKNHENQGEMIDTVMKLYGERVAAIHLKDCRIEENTVVAEVIGDGILDYQKLFSVLKAKKPFIHMFTEAMKPENYEKVWSFLHETYDNV